MNRALTWRRICVAAPVGLGAALLGFGVWREDTLLAVLGVALWIAAMIALGLIVLGRINQIRLVATSSHTLGEAPTKAGSRGRRSTGQADAPIYAGIASIPARVLMLEEAVSSIYDQVDHLFIYLNNYELVPAFLQREKITVFTSQDFGDIKDSGKFYGLTQVRNGIYLSLDDDIRYPADYARTMKKALARFNYKCVVGVHGIFLPTLAHSFFDRTLVHFRKQWDVTVPISMLGTGTTAFHIEQSGISFDVFNRHGMADVALALYLKEHKIPAIVIRRSAGWLNSLSSDDEPSLYSDTRRDATEHTKAIVAARPWGIQDLCQRVENAGIGELLPARWHAVISACRGDESSAEALGAFPLGLLMGLIRTVASGCEMWRIANLYVPKRQKDVPRHCALLRDSLALNPEGVLELSLRIYRDRRWPHEERETGLLYAGVHLAALRKLVMYEEADEFWRSLEAQQPLPADVVIEYLRLKAQQGAHEDVIALGRQYYSELNRYGDFAPLVYGAVAQVEGLQAAFHGFIPSFGRHGRPAARQRRAIVAACSHARVASTAPSLELQFVAAEDSAMQAADVRCIRDLSLLYIAIGEKQRARRLLERNRELLYERCGREMATLMLGATAETPRESLKYINEYNAYRNLEPLVGDLRVHGHFFSSLSARHRPATASASAGRISVIIAAFNAAETIGYAVRSVLAQSYPDVEVIVVDDASRDGTWEKLTELRRMDDRLQVVRNRSNVGPYICRNIALGKSTGDYVAIHDADDYAHPQRFERQLQAFQRSDVVAVLARHLRLDKDGFIALENNGEIIGDGPVTLMCRRSLFEEIGEFRAVRTRGDIEFRDRMRYYYGSHRLVHLDDILVYALHDPRSNSHAMICSPEAKRNLELFRAGYNRRFQSMCSAEELRHWSQSSAEATNIAAAHGPREAQLEPGL